MTDKLIIVESPAKASTIKKFIGGNTKVVASMGHIRDLPKSKLGINIEKNFEPEYINIRGKAPLINSLKKDAKDSKQVILATDPDREGEAIAWHLAQLLGIDEKSDCRVTFNEITKEAVKEAIKEPRKIDMNLTDAGQARRVLDRIVGYKMSPVLWKKVQKGLSAGRVQSVAVKLIVDREEEIERFIPEEYWNIYAVLEKGKQDFTAKFFGKNDKKIEVHSKEEVDRILQDIESAKYVVKEVKKGEKKRAPAPPFTTSTMQQEAARKLNYPLKKTMGVAQGLYEGVKIPEKGSVGLITYMRTDSTRVSEVARAAAKKHIEKVYGEEYYENRYYKSKKDSQDAHEAIRPTYIDVTPDSIKDSLTSDQFKLYKLIYNRFIASQMATAIYNTVSVNILANEYNFKANGQTIKFKGFMTLYIEGNDDSNSQDDDNVNLPELVEGETLKKKKLDPKQSFTEPPARYTEASLVKALEEKGIGRPSTYSPTITTILARRYIEKIQKALVPTDLGRVVNKLLVENFGDIVNEEFTAKMEEDFDKIADGEEKWKNVIKEFYGPFEKTVEKVEKELEHVTLEYEVSDVPCDKCGRMMVIKFGKYGKFLACPGFPECHNAKPLVETIDVPCPKCGGAVQIRKTKKKRNYYICENNKGEGVGCSYISWNKPKPGQEYVEGEVVEIETKKTPRKKATSKKPTAKKKATAKNKETKKK